ncbi:hypothetical protein Acr_24g0008430 [Actinidia rufa]|uniref:Transposase (putative) gypsy type domain-containing protein n=1 Tax=Actinidia rufa TaxID=165716 RepID=A0A7J0GV34_9ERIC|nr:hypothetical protein Acr_24g0008430 [Actinidia rufa]
MTDEINQSPSSPMEGSPEESPLIVVHPSVEEKTNIMTLEELNALRDTYSFPSGVQVRLPDEGEIITSTRPGELAFYEAAFPASLRFPIHPTIRLILQFYNICPAQLVPNAWRSIACSMALWRVYRYSISLTEFRNLFSLNSNPKPDQGWLYFKARNKKVLLGGYPNNVKGWKSKFFFVSSDEWEIPEGTSRKGAARVPRTWGIPSRSLFSFHSIFVFIMLGWANIVYYSFQISTAIILLGFMATKRKSLKRFFGWSRSRDASPYPCYWNPNHFAESLSLPVLGHRGRRAIICRAEKRRALRAMWVSPKIPMNKLARIPRRNLARIRAYPSSLNQMLCRRGLALKKIGEKFEKAASASSGTPALAKGVVIGEKRAGESITSSPSKKGKADDGPKGKGVDIGPEGKKKASSSSKASATPTVVPSRPGEGTSAHLGAVPGPTPSILGSPSFAERLLRGALVLGSSLAIRSREAREQASLQEGRVASMEIEVARLQKLAANFEQQLAETRAREQQALDELAKAKGDRDSLADHLGKSGALVNELREALNKAKESAMEEFKSSSEFMVAVEDAASKYFGEGFDFCKVQLRRHHPDLAIDLEGTVVDQDLLAEQDEAAEERERENLGENKGCCFSYYGEQELGDENL